MPAKNAQTKFISKCSGFKVITLSFAAN